MTRNFLKAIYAMDAVTCALVFAAGIGAGPMLAAVSGLPLSIIHGGAWICLPVALLLGWLARQDAPPALPAAAVVIGNIGWVAASFVVLAIHYPQLSAVGAIAVTVQALAVLAFALFEWAGMRHLQKATT